MVCSDGRTYLYLAHSATVPKLAKVGMNVHTYIATALDEALAEAIMVAYAIIAERSSAPSSLIRWAHRPMASHPVPFPFSSRHRSAGARQGNRKAYSSSGAASKLGANGCESSGYLAMEELGLARNLGRQERNKKQQERNIDSEFLETSRWCLFCPVRLDDTYVSLCLSCAYPIHP